MYKRQRLTHPIDRGTYNEEQKGQVFDLKKMTMQQWMVSGAVIMGVILVSVVGLIMLGQEGISLGNFTGSLGDSLVDRLNPFGGGGAPATSTPDVLPPESTVDSIRANEVLR